jgi:hypothetical protein
LINRLYAALDTAARLVCADPIYLPIFQRIERDIEVAEAMASDFGPVARARAIVRANRH